MFKGIMFFNIVWAIVTIGILVYGHLSGSEKLSVKHGLIYGLITAIVAVILVAGVVILF